MSNGTTEGEAIGASPAEVPRRAFLKSVGLAALTLPMAACTRPGAPQDKQVELHMEITRAGSQPSGKGPADWFTGNSGSMRTVPVNQSAGPLPDGCDPARVISM